MRLDVNDNKVRALVEKGEFGLEMESLRVNSDGTLAQTPHPFDGDNNITRDFCENQTEMITDVFDDIEDVLRHLKALQNKVKGSLIEDEELLWRFSNPPYFSTPDCIPIADFKGSVYRDYLAEKYGKVKMLLSGIHLNYSLPNESIEALASSSGISAKDYKDTLYLRLAADLVEYSWLIVYLTAASPILDDSFLKYSDIPMQDKEKYASVRCSEIGYWNYFTPAFDYTSADAYVKSIESYVENGDIISPSELYYPIRLKPRGKYDLGLIKNSGINHIELRMLDLNPLSEIGVFKRDLEFIHLLIIYLVFEGEDLPDRERQAEAVNNMKQAALYDSSAAVRLNGKDISVKTAAAQKLLTIYNFAQTYFPEYVSCVLYQLEKINSESYAQKIRRLYADDYMRKGLILAEKFRESGDNVHAFCGKLEGEL